MSVLLVSFRAFSQSQNGSITGIVTDATGAVVASATVTVINVGTGGTRTANTDKAGVYDVEGLPPQDYKVTVSVPGFATVTTDKFNVSVGSANKINVKLSVQAEAIIEVSANSLSGINLENAENSQVIDSEQVLELPTESRNPYDFASLSGFASSAGGERGVGVNLGGARSASTEILLDGLENTQLFSVGVAANIPVDAVQEFRVISSNYGPQYGRASGGVVNVVTKAGTNQFHGDAWEFYRPSTFVSVGDYNKANGIPQHRFVRNEFGFVVGGPVIKDKLFFFGGNEWLRVRSSNAALYVVPTSQFLALSNANTQNFFTQYGNLVGTPLGNPYTLCQIAGGAPDPVTGATVAGSTCTGGAVVDTKFGTQYATATGAPKLSDRNRLEALGAGFTETTPLFQLVQVTVPSNAGGGTPQNTYNPVGRLDFNLSSKTQMYGRYTLFNETTPVGSGNISPYAGYNTAVSYKDQNLVYGLTHTFSPSLVSQVQVGLLRVNNNSPIGSNPLGPTLFFNSTTLSLGGKSAVFPGYSATSASNGLPSGGPQNDIMVSPVFTYTKGRHTMTFGGQYTYIRDNHTFAIYANAQEALVQTGSNGSLVNFQAGQFGYFQANINPQGKYPCTKSLTTGLQVVTPACTITTPISAPAFGRSNRYQEGASFFNEEFRANSRLTLNAGLRYEIYGNQHNKNPNLDSNFYFGTTGSLQDRVRAGQILRTTDTAPAGVQSPGGKLWNTNYKQFAPRVAFAYDLTGDGKTSLRGGFGISYERNFGNVTYNVALNPPGQFAISIANTDNGGTSANPFSGTFPITPGTVGPFSSQAGLQKALPQATVRAVDPRIKPSYQEFYTLGIERQVAHSLAVGLQYQGAHGIHQYTIANYNRSYYGQVYENDPATYTTGAVNSNRLNPQFTSINVRGADGDSHYDAVNASVRASNLYKTGLTLTANYTFAHALDNTSSTFASDYGSNGSDVGGVSYFDPYAHRLDYGNADTDIRHRIAIGLVYITPKYGSNEIVRSVVGGWEFGSQYIAETGSPFTMYDSGLPAVTAIARARFLTPVSHHKTHSSTPVAGLPGYYDYIDFPARGATTANNPNYGYYVDPKIGAADIPTVINGTDTFGGGTLSGGMSQRNDFRGPGSQSFNADLIKNFKFKDRYGIQLRAELYNVLNHPNEFLNYGGTNDVNDYPFALTYKDGQRQLQLAGKITF